MARFQFETFPANRQIQRNSSEILDSFQLHLATSSTGGKIAVVLRRSRRVNTKRISPSRQRETRSAVILRPLLLGLREEEKAEKGGIMLYS